MIEIVWEHSAAREHDRLPIQARGMIEAAINNLALDPAPPGSTKLTSGGDQHRIRVGVYRVLYVLDEVPRRIRIVAVGHRRDVYR